VKPLGSAVTALGQRPNPRDPPRIQGFQSGTLWIARRLPLVRSRFAQGGNRDYGAIDWWTSSRANAAYDQVHFSDHWKVFHYSLPKAGVERSACRPERGGLRAASER